jgi:hypothetical protein
MDRATIAPTSLRTVAAQPTAGARHHEILRLAHSAARLHETSCWNGIHPLIHIIHIRMSAVVYTLTPPQRNGLLRSRQRVAKSVDFSAKRRES